MQKFLLSILVFIAGTTLNYSQTLDVNNSPNTGGGGFAVSPTQNVGQSFLAGLTGPLSQINVYFNNSSFTAGDFRLTIYSGDGYGGSVLGTQNFTLASAPPEGEYVIPISSTINVTAGNMYTMRLDGITGSGNFLAPGGSTGPYANGILYYSNGFSFNAYDLWLKTFVTLPTPATHLNFDGTDDFISLTHFQRPNEVSGEAWVKTSSTVQNTILGWGTDAATYTAEFKIVNGQLVYAEYDVAATNYQTTVSSTTINDNNWHHVAFTRSNAATSNVSLYIDGVLSGTGTASINTNTTQLSIGTFSFGGNQQYFNGSMDEVRIWNTSRTIEQINGSKNCELQGTETGLLAYYKFNQGVAGDSNATVTSATDSAGSNNGTLTNFALTGSTSNWLAPSPVTTGSIVPSNATVTTPVVYNQGATASALTATTGTNGSGLLWYTTATGGMGATTAPTPSTATAGNTSYWVSSTNANGCESPRTEIVVRVNGAGTHLNFDGVNDQVNLGNAMSTFFTGKNVITVEAWVRPETNTGLGVIVGNYVYPTNNGQIQVLLRRDTTGYGFYVDGGTGNSAVSAPGAVVLNTWQHVAGTWDGTTMRIYVNGVLINSVAKTGAFPSVSNSFVIGLNAINENFRGSIDEVRIWNKTLTASDVSNLMNCELQTSQTNLVAYYKFNQGFDSATNTGITTLTDSSGNANTGTLSNFALSGTTSNWLAGSPVTTGNTCAVLNTSNFEISSKLKMYPNPTNSLVTIEVSDLTNVKLQVLDITGKVLMNANLNTSSNSIDVSQFPSGLYMFKVTSNQGTSTSKVIKN